MAPTDGHINCQSWPTVVALFVVQLAEASGKTGRAGHVTSAEEDLTEQYSPLFRHMINFMAQLRLPELVPSLAPGATLCTMPYLTSDQGALDLARSGEQLSKP
ncbi:hypothetical protein FLONG3_6937 [Fusarium longipes]|uniref:Uncharacterized protein n=1 Tax=Fusarium longipes TaxID=694270 RepID=A0A395SHB1_9HYPO|nr:hypothetical protein FLONG3_6937 [Fusarium longipes]